MSYLNFCADRYNYHYDVELQESGDERKAQHEAIKNSTIEALEKYNTIEPSEIWKTIYAIHVNRKSGISNKEIIDAVISSDNSWKKSSGHAFEEMVKILGSAALAENNIQIILQKDLSLLIKNKALANEVRDISWLKEQIVQSTFDLYATVNKNDDCYVFGCIQSKTSIRDRVSRDREPSMQAMSAFFWSIAIVLDGEFLKNEKFKNMVNGGTQSYPTNGWHGLYVFSDKYSNGRIYPTNIKMDNLVDHAIKASQYWLTQRQWFNSQWKA